MRRKVFSLPVTLTSSYNWRVRHVKLIRQSWRNYFISYLLSRYHISFSYQNHSKEVSRLFRVKSPFRQSLIYVYFRTTWENEIIKQQNHPLSDLSQRHGSTRLHHVVSRQQQVVRPLVKEAQAALQHRTFPKNVGYRGTLRIPFPHLHKPTPGMWDLGPLSQQCGRSLSAERVCWQVKKTGRKLHKCIKFFNYLTAQLSLHRTS